jgi:hypothetical protein
MTGERRGEGTWPVGKPVFAQFRDLDPGKDGGPARTRGERCPRRDRIVVPAEPTKQMRPVDLDPARIPRRRERGSTRPRRAAHGRRRSWWPPEVRGRARRPPRRRFQP